MKAEPSQMGLMSLQKIPKGSHDPSFTRGHSEKMAVLWTREWASPEAEFAIGVGEFLALEQERTHLIVWALWVSNILNIAVRSNLVKCGSRRFLLNE